MVENGENGARGRPPRQTLPHRIAQARPSRPFFCRREDPKGCRVEPCRYRVAITPQRSPEDSSAMLSDRQWSGRF
jgi:hypothetical protein